MGTIQIDGSTPKLTIGNATAEDATILFDGNAQDFYIALDDSADDLLIGLGSTVGTTPAIAIDENLKVNIPVTTASTSASTGSLTTGGGAGIGADLYVGDDVYLITDSAILGFGADKDTTLTHTDGTGLTLNSTNKICFNDASQFIQGSSNAILALGATDEIDLTATAVDLNGTLDVSGNSQFSGTITVGVDDTGKDVKFFGATASSYMLWDESADDLNLVASGLGVGAVGVKDLGAGLHIKLADSGVSSLHTQGDELVIEDSGTTGISILSGTSGGGNVFFVDSGSTEAGRIQYDHGGNAMIFKTDATEGMRLTSAQRLGIQNNNPSYQLSVYASVGDWMIYGDNAHGSTPYGYALRFTGASPDNSTQNAFDFADSTTTRLKINADGDVVNHDNSYGSISDERIKQDITDASSQWDDIKNIKVRNFKKKDDVRQYGEAAWEQIGLIAQEAELVSPKLITENNPSPSDVLSDSSFGTLYEDGDALPEGKNIGDVKEAKSTVKAIKYSVLYMKAIKALQEAQTRIETLEAKVAVLEG